MENTKEQKEKDRREILEAVKKMSHDNSLIIFATSKDSGTTINYIDGFSQAEISGLFLEQILAVRDSAKAEKMKDSLSKFAQAMRKKMGEGLEQ